MPGIPFSELIARYRKVETAAISDAMEPQLSAMDGEIKSVIGLTKIAGPAMTVRGYPADELTIGKAIETAQKGDVIVVDLFGKVRDGTFAGDNLGTSIATRTRRGMVIHGGIRDLAGIHPIPDFGVFVRGVDPTAIANVTLLGINTPIRINEVTVLPGDIVLGTMGGVIFIPAHLAQEVVEHSEITRLRDEFGHQRLREGRYTPGQVDREWTPEIQADFEAWKKARGR